MAKIYDGIENDAFHLASAYFGIMEMVLKDATLDEIVFFLTGKEEFYLAEIAARVINDGEDQPTPVDLGQFPRIAAINGNLI